MSDDDYESDSSDLEVEDIDFDYLAEEENSAICKIECWTHIILVCDAPSWYRNQETAVYFKEWKTWTDVATCSPLTVADGLDVVLDAENPPPFSFFTTLPTLGPDEKGWGIYAVSMTKPGAKPKLYIGSGTDPSDGVSKRMAHYFPGGHTLPKFVNQALASGYTFKHVGLLCWTPMPSDTMVPRVRARFLSLEACFTFVFFAGFQAITDTYVEHTMPWIKPIDLEWEPLCSHSSLQEGVRGGLLGLSDEELIFVAAHRRGRYKRYRTQKIKEDVVAWRKKLRDQKADEKTRNPGRILKRAEKVRNKAKALERFYCEACKIPLATDSALQKHYGSIDHRNAIAGIIKPAPSKSAVKVKAIRAQAKANGDFRCESCRKNFPHESFLERHLATDLHKRRAGLL